MTDCSCEYMDVGIGLMLADPDPECPMHTPLVLEVLTAHRLECERGVGIVSATGATLPPPGCPVGDLKGES